MTGRYQQRAGIYTAGEGGSGLPLDERIFPQFLKPAGYTCGAFGKWHLGLTRPYSPLARGFDEFYGFLGRGAHDYFDLDNPDSPLYRGFEPIEDEGYLTTRLTDEATAFVKRHEDKPFFLYLAYNAVHAPKQAPDEDIRRFDTGDPDRDILMAMLSHLDEGVGRVVRTLKDQGVWENTLLFFLTDNGGSKAMHANNTPLRGFKQQNYEGGIRTPFIVSWPARFKGDRTIDTPIISLDILPTALDAAGLPSPKERPFDGKSLLPVLSGKAETLHENLFWSEGGDSGEWAVLSGQWKLVAIRDQRQLFDLEADPSEQDDLAARHPEKVKQLTRLYDTWLDQMAEPMKVSGKRWQPGQATEQRRPRRPGRPPRRPRRLN
jgi:arylsulfatase A-like enzyme